ncbi:MAG: DNA polymerase-3 subunit gamma/tau [Aureispira sp.]|jgi:DNA polymerase-3 subunit gamma/tau
MSNFVVSARKYRPIRFDDVVGQQHVSQTLKNAIQSNHLAQAFLFCGPRGVGKTTCARILAKVLNCQTPTEDMEPCDTCESCQSFNKNASLNISELDAASNNSVEHIRALIEQVRFAPQSGRYKIYIIDEVHMLSQQAFNAFLKTLEEPPSYAVFILATTEKHKIIPTILSRCQIFDFNRIQVSDMTTHLQKICKEEKIEAEEEALTIIAQKADGALRDSLSIFDRIVSFSGNKISYQDVIENLNILDYDYYFKVVEAMLTEDASQLLLLFDQISRKGFDGDIFINGLAEHLRNLLVCKDPRTIELLEVSGNIKERYNQQANLAPTGLILSALSLANDCDVNYKMARNHRLHVEMALIKMAYIQRAMEPRVVQTIAAPSEKKTLADSKTVTVQEITPTYKVESLETPVVVTPIEPPKNSTTDTEEPIAELKSDNAPAIQVPEIQATNSFAAKLALKKGNNLSAQILNEVKEEYKKPLKEAMPFTQENLAVVWKEYWSKIDSQSTQILFKNSKLSILDAERGVIKILTSGNRAKDAIFRDRTIRQLLIQTFQKKDLTFEVEIDEAKIEAPRPQKIIPQTDREKYVHFLGLNPILKDFQKRFQLLPPKNN